MSQENVEVVRRVYAAMNAGDPSVVIELAAPDMEWVPDRRVGEGPIRGRDNVIRFFTDRASAFGEFAHEIERAWEQDEQVLVFLLVTGKGATSDAGFEIRIAHLWTLRDGVLARGQGFGDRSEALKAAGLRG
ncbi:MAG: nuclear transport factor 2 family protein [bacterium]